MRGLRLKGSAGGAGKSQGGDMWKEMIPQICNSKIQRILKTLFSPQIYLVAHPDLT